MTNEQQKFYNEVKMDVSILLAEWAKEKFDNGVSVDEVKRMLRTAANASGRE